MVRLCVNTHRIYRIWTLFKNNDTWLI